MIVTQEQIDSVNKHPLNQVARIFLKRAGVTPDPTGGLYLYQLIEWGIENGAVAVSSPSTASYLLESIRKLSMMKPLRAMKVLTHREEVSQITVMLKNMKMQKTPVTASAYLIDQLEIVLEIT